MQKSFAEISKEIQKESLEIHISVDVSKENPVEIRRGIPERFPWRKSEVIPGKYLKEPQKMFI